MNLRLTIKRPTLKGTTMERVEYKASQIKRIEGRLPTADRPNQIPEREEIAGSSYRLVIYDEIEKEKGGV